jgi:adenosylcobinamide-phosphate synthase
MGGPTTYFGQVKDKPFLGPEGVWDDGRLARLVRLALVTGILSGLFMAAYAWAMTVLRA